VLIGFILLVWFLFTRKPKEWSPILLWLVISPFAAALTFQSPHALRAQSMAIPLVIISAYGLISLSKWLHKVIHKKVLLNSIFVIFFLIISWQFARYLHMYWVHMAKEYPYSSQYGFKELASYIKEEEGKYDEVIITTRYDQPYILLLFYLKYPTSTVSRNHVCRAETYMAFQQSIILTNIILDR